MVPECSLPGFWPMFLGPFLERDLPALADDLDTWVDPVPRLFGVTPAEETAMEEALFLTKTREAFRADESDPAVSREVERLMAGVDCDALRSSVAKSIAWELYGPKNRQLTLTLPRGWAVVVDFDPQALSFELAHPSLAAPLALGHVGPHHALPGLRYAEARAFAQLATNTDPARAALCLLPLCALGDEPEMEIRAWVRALWQASGAARPEHLDEITRRTVVPTYCAWRHDVELGWVNDSSNSHRNPDDVDESSWRACDGFRELRRAFAELGVPE